MTQAKNEKLLATEQSPDPHGASRNALDALEETGLELKAQVADQLSAIKDAEVELKKQATDRLSAIKDAEVELKKQVTDQLSAIKDAEVELKKQVIDQVTEQKQSTHELKEAKSALSEVVTKHIQMQQGVLNELNVHKWGLRFFWVALFSGSLYGLYKFQPYIDERVRVRASPFESRLTEDATRSQRLNLALAMANSGDWRDALTSIDEIYKDIKEGKMQADRSHKDIVYGNMVWIMSQLDVMEPSNTWMGQEEWNNLMSDQDFRINFLTAQWLEADDPTNVSLAICTLKFDQGSNAMESAQNYFRRAANHSDPEYKKAPRLFGLAMIDLINNDQDSALAKLRRAGEIDPTNYRASEFAKNFASYKNNTDYRIYNVAAQRRHIEFGPRLEALVSRVLKDVEVASSPASKAEPESSAATHTP